MYLCIHKSHTNKQAPDIHQTSKPGERHPVLSTHQTILLQQLLLQFLAAAVAAVAVAELFSDDPPTAETLTNKAEKSRKLPGYSPATSETWCLCNYPNTLLYLLPSPERAHVFFLDFFLITTPVLKMLGVHTSPVLAVITTPTLEYQLPS